MGLRILCSPPTAFPSPGPADTPPAWLRSGLCPPELGEREILGSVLLMLPVPRPSGELQSPERFWSKPISDSEAGLGVPDAQWPPRDTRLACRRVSLDKLASVKFIPEPGLDSTFSPSEILQTSVSVCRVAKFWKKCVTQNASDDKEKDQERNLMDLEHKSQSKASRSERRGKTRKKEKTNKLWCRIFPLKMIHNDSASFFSSLVFFPLKRQQFLFGVCGAAVCPKFDSPLSLRPSDSLSLCLSPLFESFETCGQIQPTHAEYIYSALTNHINI